MEHFPTNRGFVRGGSESYAQIRVVFRRLMAPLWFISCKKLEKLALSSLKI
jgi:hypothetical protein